MKKISLVIVTYNRLELLKECLENVFSFSTMLSHIIIIDNASNEDTKNYLNSLDSKISYVRLQENIGGAGGFYTGIKYFIEQTEDDYVWLMDDDTMPNESALKELTEAADKLNNFGFLASNIRWEDGSPAKMNIPSVDEDFWNENNDYVRLSRATFVSVLFTRNVVKNIGYPIKEFFIWGDDTEYTQRISNRYPSYFVSNSMVLHKIKNNFGADLITDDSERLNRYFYAYRNRYYNARNKSKKSFIKYKMRVITELIRILFGKNIDNRLKRSRILVRGTIAGVYFKPIIEKSEC